jgi:ribosomal peptide maturation radical SAM protein 1
VAFPATAQVYQQQVPSLALARRIKAASPRVITVMAGECFEGIMGLETLKQFWFVDFVISGETELLLPSLLAALLREEHISPARGVYRRQDISHFRSGTGLPNTALIQNLDELPVPDHSDYFEQRDRYGIEGPRMITFETARGCWWTSRSNWCRFCSLHGQDTQYRAKSQGRALRELRHLVQAYSPKVVWALDFVLNRAYFRDFIPALAREHLGVSICYEVRPDLTKEAIRALAEAGINNIQVGVESFSTKVLQAIAKGVSGLQNVQFLKWAREFGIHVRWNILFRLPASEAADYETNERLLPLISHFGGRPFAVNFVLQRYSPYYQRKDRHFAEVKPAPAYALIFRGVDSDAVENLAYNFEYRTGTDHSESDACRARLTRLIESHIRHASTSALCFWELGRGVEELVVLDLRPIAVNRLARLRGLARFLYKACDSVQNADRLHRMAAQKNPADWKEQDVDLTLEDLVARKLMVREDDQFIALAIPLSGAWMTEGILDGIITCAGEAGLLDSLRGVAEDLVCEI